MAKKYYKAIFDSEGRPVLRDHPTLGELQPFYEMTAPARINTYKNFCRQFQILVDFFGEDTDPRYITRASVGQYKTWLEKKGYVAKGYVDRGSAFFIWLQNIGVMDWSVNPFRSFGRWIRNYTYTTHSRGDPPKPRIHAGNKKPRSEY